jgi:hypothetical protein
MWQHILCLCVRCFQCREVCGLQSKYLPAPAVCPMSCFTACKRTQKWRGSCHFRQKSLGHFSPIDLPSAAGFTSVASDTGGLLWRKLERSKSLVLLQVGGLTCRWQQHSVKPSCWECSTTVEQAETQLRVVVQIEEDMIYISAFVGVQYLVNLQNARCSNKDN